MMSVPRLYGEYERDTISTRPEAKNDCAGENQKSIYCGLVDSV
jgi:hypothetical protein